MGYRFLEHMTDALIEAEGNTLEEAFENAAKGLVDTMIDINKVDVKEEIALKAEGYDLNELLYNWLEEVMLKLLVDRLALKEFKVKIHDNKLEAKAYGEPLNLDKHGYKVEIKGVTYHLMSISKDDNRYKVRFLLDL